ncbi:AGAP013447-PA, partial [Anopheles gambiae str. PEST]
VERRFGSVRSLSHANEPPISSINSSTATVATNPATTDTNYHHPPKGDQKIVRPHRPPPPPPPPLAAASTHTTTIPSPSAGAYLDRPPSTKPPPPPPKVEPGSSSSTTTTTSHRKSVSFDLHEDTHGFDTALHHARAAFAGPSPTPDLKGILRASSPSNRSSSSTPEGVQQVQPTVANLDSDPDTDSDTGTESDTDSDASGDSHELLPAAPREKPPASNPIRRAEVVRNQAARKLQEEFGQGDLVEYEHDTATNTIREVSVGPGPAARGRPERVEMLPAKFETLPVKRTAQFVHENTPNNLLVPDEVHRQVLLEENEVRNKLLAQYAHEQQQQQQQQQQHHHHHQQQHMYTMHHHHHTGELLGRVPSPYHLYDSGTASVSPLPSHYIPGGSSSVYDHHQHLGKLGGPLSPPPPLPSTAPPSDVSYHHHHLPQIYPPVQILPVHYTKLPTPQHTIYTYASGSVPVSHAPIVSLAASPSSQPVPYSSPYHLPPYAGTSAGPTYLSTAHPSSSIAAGPTHPPPPGADAGE